MSWKASYATKVVTDNYTIQRDKFSCLCVDNVGASPIKVNGIYIGPGSTFLLNEDPGTIINTDFLIEFIPLNPGDLQLVNIVMTYYKESHKENI